MQDKANPLMEIFVKDMLHILLDLEKSSMFGINDLVGVKNVFANAYFQDDMVLTKLSNDQTLRERYGSLKLLSNLINNIKSNLDDNIDYKYFQQNLKYINSFEQKFFSNTSFGSSLKFLLEFIKIVTNKFHSATFKNEKERAECENLLPILFEFYERTILSIQLDNNSKNDFVQLYNHIKIAFKNNNYGNARNFFKFYFLYLKNPKENFINPNDVDNTIVQFLNSGNSAKIILDAINTAISLPEFLKEKSTYKQTLISRAGTHKDFFDAIIMNLSEPERNNLFDVWVQKTSVQAKSVIVDNIDGISDRLGLAEKLLARANSLNNNLNEKKGFLDLLFSIGLTKEKILSTNYTNQIKTLIFNTNLGLHDFGISQLQEHRAFINTKGFKTNAENFLVAYIKNLRSYHKQIQNIITNKLGLTTVFVDKHISNNPEVLNVLNSFFVNTGDLAFYSAITSKLYKSTVHKLNEKLINSISKNARYEGILKSVKKDNFSGLSDTAKEKLSSLVE